MICQPCREQRHDRCYDTTVGTDYRSCFCQHVTRPHVVESLPEVTP